MKEQKKSLSGGQIAILCLLALVAVLLIVLIVVMVRNAPGKAAATAETTETIETAEETAEEPLLTVNEEEVSSELPAGVALQCGTRQLTATDLNYHYWDIFMSMVNNYGDAITDYFDPTVPLEDQVYDESSGTTWADYMMNAAVSTAIQVSAFANAADEAGFTMPAAYQSDLDALIEDYRTLVAEQGYEDLTAYLQDTYGPEATEESYLAYQTDYYLATAYSDSVYDAQTVTAEEIEAYYDENAETLAAYGIEKDDTPMVSLRHILVIPEDTEDEASWSSAEASANEIYALWQEEPTEENFARLAEEYSQDTGSTGNGGDWTEAFNGGLYTDVYNGSMDETFTAWLFDSARNPGDVGVMRTGYGWSLLYYVTAQDQAYWQYTVENELLYERYQEAADEIYAAWPYLFDQEAFVVNIPAGLYDSAEETTEQTAS